MSTVVDELVADLSVNVNQGTFTSGEAALAALGAAAQAMSAAVAALDARLAGVVPRAGAAAAKVEAATGLGGAGVGGTAQAVTGLGQIEGAAAKTAGAVAHAEVAALEGAAAHAGSASRRAVHQLEHLYEKGESVAKFFLGGFLAFEAVHLVHEFSEQMQEMSVSIERASIKIGISTDAVQELRYAAQQTATDVGSLDQGLRFLQVNAANAGKKGNAAGGEFKALGIQLKDASGQIKPTDALFEEVAGKIAAIEDPTQRTAAAVRIFGRSGQQLIPLLDKGAEGIRAFREEAVALGGGLSEETIAKSVELEEQTKKLDFALLSLKSSIGGVIIPALLAFSERVQHVIVGIQNVAKHTEFFGVLLKVGFAGALLYAAFAMRALTASQWDAIGAAIAGYAVFFAWAAGIAVAALIIEDLYALLTGKKSLIGQWLDEWLGIGTVDELTRSWHVGIDQLRDSINGLLETAVDAGRIIKDFFSLDITTKQGAAKWDKEISAFGARSVNPFKGYAAQYSDLVEGKRADTFGRATGRGLNASAVFDQSTPRAVARGLGAALQAGSAGFGQASKSSAGVTVVNNSHVEVHAKTHADAHEIARVAVHEINKHHTKTTRKLKEALVP